MYLLALLLLSAGTGLFPALVYVIARMNRIRALYGAPRQDNTAYHLAASKALKRFYTIWLIVSVVLFIVLPGSGFFPDTSH